ncbi:hypothetical protein V6N11_043884 [Hibiscus sabdariffa]|uniref:Uncharacterized protein n=1 Tax=Hibiscus sabdariffa TaxID=183260 RepID=A0ABR2RDI5_9ROSI
MGASESVLSGSLSSSSDQITTISKRSETVDPVLEKLKSLKITSPLLTTPPTEGSLTDILVRKPSSSSAQDHSTSVIKVVLQLGCAKLLLVMKNSATLGYIATVNPKVLAELFSMYRDWQEEKAQEISKKQEEIENKIEVADALTVKLLQRLNHSVSTMATTSQHLSEVHTLEVELGELKGRLTEVLCNCDALCKRIAAEGPEHLRSSIKPFAVPMPNHCSSSDQRVEPMDGSTSMEER